MDSAKAAPNQPLAAPDGTAGVATCPRCATAFRITKEQLLASNGWVRCGRCLEIFDGNQAPTEHKTPAPQAPVPAASPPEVQRAAQWHTTQAQTNSPPVDDMHGALRAPQMREWAATAAESAQHGYAEPADSSTPVREDLSFVSQARRRAFWSRPAVRLLLVLAIATSAASLFVQWLRHESHAIRSGNPRLAPLVNWMCQLAPCSVTIRRRLEALSIETSNFTKDATLGRAGMRLSITLKNSFPKPVLVPHFELTLTDGQAVLLHRIVLDPIAIYGWGEERAMLSGTQSGSGEHKFEFAINTAGAPREVAGYKLLLFYP